MSHLLSQVLGRSDNSPRIEHGGVTTILNTSTRELKLNTLVNGRIPICLKPKPGSLTHLNLARFLLQELSAAAADVPALGQKDFAEIVCQLESQVQTIISNNAQSAACLKSATELFDSDFEVSCARRVAPAAFQNNDNGSAAPVERECKFELHQSASSRSQIISGFLSIEWEQPTAASAIKLSAAEFRNRLRFVDCPVLALKEHEATVKILVSMPVEFLEQVEFFVHWGNYEDLPVNWNDTSIDADEISPILQGLFQLEKTILVKSPGHYGATVFARLRGSSEDIWQGRSYVDDLKFVVHHELADKEQKPPLGGAELRSILLEKLRQPRTFAAFLQQSRVAPEYRYLAREAFKATEGDAEGSRLLGNFADSVKNLRTPANVHALDDFFARFGVGEIVMVSPEGPHAISGGLAQVTTGFLKAFSRRGVPITLIAPLYEASQGNRHKSAETYIKEGINLNGRMVALKHLGKINVNISPTHWHAGGWAQPPLDVHADVYLAEDTYARIVFVRQPMLAQRLYDANHPDSQLRSAVFLARAALETMRCPDFNINPHIIVSNDWLTGLVPVLVKTDPRYSADPVLSQCHTVHMLHNCGRSYQGKMPLHFGNQDLWGMLGIGGEHFFGLRDPWDGNALNLTVGAVTHSSSLLTVSQPYARELLTVEGSECILETFSARANQLYGVSNGIDLHGLRQLYATLAENARLALGLPLLKRPPHDETAWLLHLDEYKQNLKQHVQRKYGLTENHAAPLLVMVGRLAEQKGIQLLADWYEGRGLLHTLLTRYPGLQILIAGPLVDGHCCSHLRALVNYLECSYPGSARGVFDFIKHRDALELTAAADLFLMPSRYEPGGLTQLEALAAGTPVIGRKVGGIAATIENYDPATNQGTGFLFESFHAGALFEATRRALDTISNNAWRKNLMRQAAHANHDWDDRVKYYLSLFQKVSGVLDSNLLPHAQGTLLDGIKAV